MYSNYSFTQTLAEVTVWVPVPPGTKGRACDVHIARKHLRVGVKGQPPVVDGALFAAVKPEECAWTISDNKMIEVTLCKQEGMCWWSTVIEGDEEIDVQQVCVLHDGCTYSCEWPHAVYVKRTSHIPHPLNPPKVEPENSKLTDLDGETRATVEKMMWDQRQKQMGKPTSDEMRKQQILQQFMSQHPEMDFSQAKIM